MSFPTGARGLCVVHTVAPGWLTLGSALLQVGWGEFGADAHDWKIAEVISNTEIFQGEKGI